MNTNTTSTACLMSHGTDAFRSASVDHALEISALPGKSEIEFGRIYDLSIVPNYLGAYLLVYPTVFILWLSYWKICWLGINTPFSFKWISNHLTSAYPLNLYLKVKRSLFHLIHLKQISSNINKITGFSFLFQLNWLMQTFSNLLSILNPNFTLLLPFV